MSQQFDFIDFYDSSQIYLDFLSSCACGLHHIASISDEEKDLESIAVTIDFAVQKLREEFEKYSDLEKKEGEK